MSDELQRKVDRAVKLIQAAGKVAGKIPGELDG